MSDTERHHSDRILMVAIGLLLLIGVMMVFSASSFRGAEKYGDSMQFIKSHLTRVATGLFLLTVMSVFNYNWIKGMTPFLLLTVLIMLFVVLAETKVKGSSRWLTIFGKQIQPSEFMKLAVIFYLAVIFSRGPDTHLTEGRRLYYHYAFVLGITCLVFIEPDLGSAMVIFFIGFIMFFLGGVEMKRLGVMGMAVLPVAPVGFLAFPYQFQRFISFYHSVIGREPPSYQMKQAIVGIAHGGLWGVGYGGGKQKLFFLPEPFSDFILASLGEELGFIGLALVMLLLMVVMWRALWIAKNAPDRFSSLLAGGICAMILINATLNAGVVVNLLPTTGLPFPFLSYGGSSLFVNLLGVGILLNISKSVQTEL